MTKYIIMAQIKRKNADLETGRPLAYGRDKEPAHQELLFRGRATAFDSEAQAWKALEASLLISEANGGVWVKCHQYFLLEIA